MAEPHDGRSEFAGSLRALLPHDWRAKESMTFLAPDGQANVIASSEPIDPSLDTARYAQIQGELLRREFPGFEERRSGPDAVFGGREGFRREFTWVPPDGVRVFQTQVYWVNAGRGYTATSTATVADHAGAREVLDSVHLGSEGTTPEISATVADPDRTVLRPASDRFPAVPPPSSAVTDSISGTVSTNPTGLPPGTLVPGSGPASTGMPLSVVPPTPPARSVRVPDRMPAEAVPGSPPPPLPEPVGSPPVGRPDVTPAHDDPAAHVDKSSLLPWFPRLHYTGTGWTAATELRLEAPARTVAPPDAPADVDCIVLDDGRYLVIGEAPLTCRAVRVRTPGLAPAPPGTPLLSRLRALHAELFDPARWPISAAWYPIAGSEGVLDRLGHAPAGATTAFLLSAALGADHGVVAYGAAPPARSEALVNVAIPLSGLVTVPEADGAPLSWWRPPGWHQHERLRLCTEEVTASAQLRPPADRQDPEQWRAELLAEAAVPAESSPMVRRPAELEGFGTVTVERFERSTQFGSRLTSIVHGLADPGSFGLVVDVALNVDEAIGHDVDELLGDLRVQ